MSELLLLGAARPDFELGTDVGPEVLTTTL